MCGCGNRRGVVATTGSCFASCHTCRTHMHLPTRKNSESNCTSPLGTNRKHCFSFSLTEATITCTRLRCVRVAAWLHGCVAAATASTDDNMNVQVTSADKVCILAVPRGWYSVRWVLRIQHAAGAHSTTRTVVCRVAGGEATEEWGWVPGQVWRAAMRAFGRVCMLSLKHPSIRAHMVIHLRPRCIAGPRASRRLSIGCVEHTRLAG